MTNGEHVIIAVLLLIYAEQVQSKLALFMAILFVGISAAESEVFSPHLLELRRRTSKSTTAVAEATLREPSRPATGIRTR